ncbi:hypothetical protein V8F33_005991 [Rhypophila sp. PSN 637]
MSTFAASILPSVLASSNNIISTTFTTSTGAMSIFAERILPNLLNSSNKMISTISTTISSFFKRVISATVSQRMIHTDSPKDLAPICTQRRDKGAKRPKRSVYFAEILEQPEQVPSQRRSPDIREPQERAKPRNAYKAAYERPGDWHPDQWFGLVPNPKRRVRSILKKTGPVPVTTVKRKPWNACQSIICQKCRKGGSTWLHKHGGLEMLNESLKKQEVEKPKVVEPEISWEWQTSDVRNFVCFALIFTGICLMAPDGILSRLLTRRSGIEDDFWEVRKVVNGTLGCILAQRSEMEDDFWES